MSLASVLVAAAEAEHSAVNPYLIGAITLAVLLLMVFGVLAFGAGRDHS